MGDVVKMLFGGSSTKQQSTSTPVDMTPGEFTALRGPFADTLKALLTSGGPEYTGPMFSPITGTEQNILGDLNTQAGTGTARAGYLNNVINGGFLPGQPGSNPFLQAAIEAAQRPTLQGLEETLSRTLPGRFTQAGQFVQPGGSSAFDRAAAIATRGAADAIGDIATKISAGNYEAERGRQQEAVQLSRQEVDASISNLQAQALPRMIQELGIERGLALFQQKTQAVLDLLKTIGGVTSPTVANKGTSTGEGSSYSGIFKSIPIFGK